MEQQLQKTDQLIDELKQALEIDCQKEEAHIIEFIQKTIKELHKDGAVIGLSGGLDSSMCAYLLTKAIGKDKVLAVLLPERDSSAVNHEHAHFVAKTLGLKTVGPSVYEKFVFPAEKDLIGKLPKPSVLSVCGRMDKVIHLLAQTGADAVSIDQTTDIKSAREALGNVMLFGNLDPMETLYRGDETDITEAVHGAKEAGVDAVWPGCDLVPSTPIRNIARMTTE